MTYSTLIKTIVITHQKHGDFKFEIYVNDRYYSADIQQRNGDGRWENFQINYGFPKAQNLDDAQTSCKKFIEILGR